MRDFAKKKVRNRKNLCAPLLLRYSFKYHPKKEIKIPAATAEPITPDTLEDMQ